MTIPIVFTLYVCIILYRFANPFFPQCSENLKPIHFLWYYNVEFWISEFVRIYGIYLLFKEAAKEEF